MSRNALHERLRDNADVLKVPGGNDGRLAGTLLGAARSNATVDAVVVASAIGAGGGVILTGGPGNLEGLAGDHPDVVIQSL
ncbi:MAG: hypothetical protein M3387_02215 [Actinomycetota bacterium]|nr:hypothetical protein [Actinomycetota bacterium]